jgi:hypothetical protein
MVRIVGQTRGAPGRARRLLDELANASANGDHMRRILTASAEQLDEQTAAVLVEDFKILVKFPNLP